MIIHAIFSEFPSNLSTMLFKHFQDHMKVVLSTLCELSRDNGQSFGYFIREKAVLAIEAILQSDLFTKSAEKFSSLSEEKYEDFLFDNVMLLLSIADEFFTNPTLYKDLENYFSPRISSRIIHPKSIRESIRIRNQNVIGSVSILVAISKSNIINTIFASNYENISSNEKELKWNARKQKYDELMGRVFNELFSSISEEKYFAYQVYIWDDNKKGEEKKEKYLGLYDSDVRTKILQSLPIIASSFRDSFVLLTWADQNKDLLSKTFEIYLTGPGSLNEELNPGRLTVIFQSLCDLFGKFTNSEIEIVCSSLAEPSSIGPNPGFKFLYDSFKSYFKKKQWN